MDFFSKLGDSIVSATQEVGEKAKGMTDVAKLQYEMRSKEDFLNKQYQEIGKIFYQENKDAAPEAYTSLFEEVVAAQKRIEEIKEQIAYTKGGKACPKCGAKMDEDIFEDEDEVVTEEKTDEVAEETVETVSGEVVEEDEE